MNSTTNVSNAVLVDTNILVYTHDPRDRAKQRQALSVLGNLVLSGRAVISVQCLTEFHSVASKRLSAFMTAADLRREVEMFARSCSVLPLTEDVVLEAVRSTHRRRLSLWDSLIWAVAKLNAVPVILTEDSAHGQVLDGIAYSNPFDPRFQLAAL
jgi:predicted nucleic acid-binding protein